MAQQTLGGKPSSLSKPLSKSNDEAEYHKRDFKSTQLPIGKTKDDLEAEMLEGKKCPICKEVKPKMFDICKDESNVTACEECIRERHQRKGLSGLGFRVTEEKVFFYSHTTGMESCQLDEIYRVFLGICFPNKVFPYCINLAKLKRVPKKETYNCAKCGHSDDGFEEKIETNCLGITKEFGEYLIKNIKWDKTKEGKPEEDEDSIIVTGDNLTEWERVTETHKQIEATL